MAADLHWKVLIVRRKEEVAVLLQLPLISLAFITFMCLSLCSLGSSRLQRLNYVLISLCELGFEDG